jgi:hypothetical protein
MVYHSRPEKWLVASGSAFWQQGEHCVIDWSRAVAVHGHAFWSLQCSSDIWEVNETVFKRPLLRVMSHVPWRRDWPHVPRASVQPAESVPTVPRSLPKAQSRKVPALSEGSMVPWPYCVVWGHNHWPRVAESHSGITDSEEQTWNKKLSGPTHILQMCYFRFCQYCKTANQTHEGEVSLSLDSRIGGCLSNVKGGPLYCPYSCLPAAKREIHRWHRRE